MSRGQRYRRYARLSVIDGTVVGSSEGCIADEVVVRVIDLKGECREEEEGASLKGGDDATAGLKAVRAYGVKQATELRNVCGCNFYFL